MNRKGAKDAEMRLNTNGTNNTNLLYDPQWGKGRRVAVFAQGCLPLLRPPFSLILQKKDMTIFKKLFRPKEHEEPQPLAIEGIPDAPVTPEPDDAELAAQALLEMMAAQKKDRDNDITSSRHNERAALRDDNAEKTTAYYHALASRIREAHAKSVRQATRFVAACEYTLKDKHLPYYGAGSLQLLEAELYKRIDIIEREGGELKRRWQHCLAEVTVRLMDAPPPKEKADAPAEQKPDNKDGLAARN